MGVCHSGEEAQCPCGEKLSILISTAVSGSSRNFVRFLHVIPSVDRKAGGTVEALCQIASLHQELGHTIEVASLDRPGSPHRNHLPFPVHELGPGIFSYGFTPKFTSWLRRHGPRFDAAIIHGLWQYPGHAARVALAGRVPYFVYTHGMLDPWFNRRFPLKHIKKTIYWHACMRRDLDESAGVIFTCQKELERSISAFFPFQWKGIVAPLGIAEPSADSAAQISAAQSHFPRLKDRRFLLFLGRIHPKKGCDLLLRAFASVCRVNSELMLVMAGPGDPAYVSSLHRIVVREKIEDRVVWAGMVAGALKWGLLRSAEAFVLPSHQENFAIATIEAMAVNTPVLISDKVQIWPEVLRSGAGLVEPDTLEGTGSLLRSWLSLPENERDRMGRAGLACYRERYTIDHTGRALLNELTARLRSLKSGIDPGTALFQGDDFSTTFRRS